MKIQASGLHKIYITNGAPLNVLNGIDIGIEESKMTAILGPSGAGKSTLMHILSGLDEPSKGKVFFDNINIFEKPGAYRAALRNNDIGFVFQFYYLMSEFSVLENIMLPGLIGKYAKRKDLRQRAIKLLDEVGLKNRMGHKPNQLSGGEQQRAAIARALINDPLILFCDEPTGNLDSLNSQNICRLLTELNKEKKMTIVVVTHDKDIAKLADKIINIKDGELI